MEDDEIIAKDKVNHPDCSYSISFNETCSDKNGQFVCESLKNFQRICPGAKPVTVYSKKQQFTGNPENHTSSDDHMKFFNFQSRSFGSEDITDAFGLAENFMNRFMSDFGNIRPPQLPPNVPPHRMETPQQQQSPSIWGHQRNPTPKISGRVIGPEEEI